LDELRRRARIEDGLAVGAEVLRVEEVGDGGINREAVGPEADGLLEADVERAEGREALVVDGVRRVVRAEVGEGAAGDVAAEEAGAGAVEDAVVPARAAGGIPEEEVGPEDVRAAVRELGREAEARLLVVDERRLPVLAVDDASGRGAAGRRAREGVVEVERDALAEERAEVDLEPTGVAVVAGEVAREGARRELDLPVEEADAREHLVEDVLVEADDVEHGELAELLREADLDRDRRLRLES